MASHPRRSRAAVLEIIEYYQKAHPQLKAAESSEKMKEKKKQKKKASRSDSQVAQASPKVPTSSRFIAEKRHSESSRTAERRRFAGGSWSFRRASIVHEVAIDPELDGLFTIAYSPDGDYLGCGFGSGDIEVREAATGELRATLRSGSGATAVPIVCTRFHPKNGTFYAASACGSVFLCSAAPCEYSRFCHEDNNEINALAVGSRGDRLVTGGKDAALRLYDTSTGDKISEVRLSLTETAKEPHHRVHCNRIYGIVFDNRSHHTLVSGGWDDTVKVWDTRAFRSPVGTIFGPHICGDAIDVQNDRVLTGSWKMKDSVQTWDLRTFRCLSTMSPVHREGERKEGDFVYVAKFFDGDPHGDTACVGGSGSRALQLVSLSQGKVVESLRSSKTVQALAMNGQSLVYGGMEPVIRSAMFS